MDAKSWEVRRKRTAIYQTYSLFLLFDHTDTPYTYKDPPKHKHYMIDRRILE